MKPVLTPIEVAPVLLILGPILEPVETNCNGAVLLDVLEKIVYDTNRGLAPFRLMGDMRTHY